MKISAKIFWFFLCIFVIGLNFPAAFNTKAHAQLLPDWTNVTTDPFTLYTPSGITNPVLAPSDVTDVTASFVADPFMVHDNGIWYMFFEVFIPSLNRGEIGLATSDDGLNWSYDRIVLAESFHLSYPLVLKYNGEYYMIPETAATNSIRVYKAGNFPYNWVHIATIASGRPFVDSTIFRYNSKWWMFTAGTGLTNGILYLFYSNNLLSGWIEHPMSPIINKDRSKNRPGGRSFVFDNGRIIRLAQKNDITYGQRVRAFQVDTLTETAYAEHEIVESPVIYESGIGWNAFGMHQFDPWWTGSQWICVVDGDSNSISDDGWSIGILMAPRPSVQVDVISPSDYKTKRLLVGDQYFLDRTYVLTSIPSDLAVGGEVWIKTENADKYNSSDSFLQFNISQESTVYVGYDSRATALPLWLQNNFISTGLQIGVSDSMGHYDVYAKRYLPGSVVLGGNNATGAIGASSHYIVIIQPPGPESEICNNGTDDDSDSLTDCDDPDCALDPGCSSATEICDNGIDDDSDGLTDCADPDCDSDPACIDGLTILTPSDYVVMPDLQAGDTYYSDRSYTLTSIPSEFVPVGEEWIVTQNADKSNTSASFLQFNVSQTSTVYVGYDPRATALPNWLTGFTPTALTIGVSDSGMGYFKVYSKSFSAGTVVLGGNLAGGASGASSNYIVIVKPAGASSEMCDNGIDDDSDGLTDCADPDCTSDPICSSATEICDNGIDDDTDGLTDCADPDCASDPACIDGLTILTPSDYVVMSDLQAGDTYYSDRSYTLTSIPSEFVPVGEEWIVTQNADKSNTSASFLQFNISQTSTVYVGYDPRATALPNWLTGFTPTALTIGVSDSGMGYFMVYSKSFPAGTVILGGNLASGASGASSNYIVIVKKN